jgi:hypothetical protein
MKGPDSNDRVIVDHTQQPSQRTARYLQRVCSTTLAVVLSLPAVVRSQDDSTPSNNKATTAPLSEELKDAQPQASAEERLQLIAQLNDDNYWKREKAQKNLTRLCVDHMRTTRTADPYAAHYQPRQLHSLEQKMRLGNLQRIIGSESLWLRPPAIRGKDRWDVRLEKRGAEPYALGSSEPFVVTIEDICLAPLRDENQNYLWDEVRTRLCFDYESHIPVEFIAITNVALPSGKKDWNLAQKKYCAWFEARGKPPEIPIAFDRSLVHGQKTDLTVTFDAVAVGGG